MQFVLAVKHLDEQFYDLIKDLIHNEAVQRLADITHHHFTNRLEHSISVAYLSYRIAKKWNLDVRSISRAALLHDFFHEDRTEMAKLSGGSHSYLHPKIAVSNALKITELSEKERDIILKHMFLVSKCWLPSYKESYIVTFVDKYIAIKEVSMPLISVMKHGIMRHVLRMLPSRS